MAEPATWQSAFVATTLAVGGSLDDARASLGSADQAQAAAVLPGLAHGQRDVRAKTLAAALGRVVADLELTRLA